MSSEKICEKQIHRKPKVSWGRLIHPGLVDPKLRLNSVSDGYAVNIRQLVKWCLKLVSDAEGMGLPSVGCLGSCLGDGMRGP